MRIKLAVKKIKRVGASPSDEVSRPDEGSLQKCLRRAAAPAPAGEGRNGCQQAKFFAATSKTFAGGKKKLQTLILPRRSKK